MKIAVSSKGAGLGAWIEPELKDCGFLMVVDDNLRFKAIQNTGNILDMINQGIDEGIEALVTGSVAEDIIPILRDKNIKIYIARQGSILELVESVRDGSLAKLV